jgi:1-pyrroline-5-carboxylate dehydrogenase
MSESNPHHIENLLEGEWSRVANPKVLVDPMNGKTMLYRHDVSDEAEIDRFVQDLNSCPRSGLHNPFKNVHRYVEWGHLTSKVASEMRKKEVEDFFTHLIQRVAPKSEAQARGEVIISRQFLENFGGDNVRFLARGFSVTGDHDGQRSNGFRWPYGPSIIVAPFNFPLEIPLLQTMGALYMGNKVMLKCASTVSAVMEQYCRLMQHCDEGSGSGEGQGLVTSSLTFVNCGGRVMGSLIEKAKPKMTQFTGSSSVANNLSKVLNGKIKIEDAGFDWKILGPDVASNVDYIAYQCDQDAYAFSGQKCSAQSILFVHENYRSTNLLASMQRLAEQRNYGDLTLGPILSVSNEEFLSHIQNIKNAIPQAEVLWGGAVNTDNNEIPTDLYGSFQPTAVKVPIQEIVKGEENFCLVSIEIFGPFQIVVEYGDEDIPTFLDICDRMNEHLTAAVVSNDQAFVQRILGNTINGTTYAGLRARTTGAPQNHWFGPCGDPRGAGIGTKEAIQLVWSSHREVIFDQLLQDDQPIPAQS